MPQYLKNYATEFNYLFQEIHNCCDETKSLENSRSFYNFGNNLRKFLEAYLFFKYPYIPKQSEKNKKLQSFFNGDGLSTSLTNRLSNELSHLEESFDRGMKPIDVAEISKLAKFVIKKMSENDLEQLNALLKSIDLPEHSPQVT